ncbi:MAG: hypothetical protein KDH15_21695, partial [Rhodocyclaceae bacterium]|nr:hypothetical protein [Rhodocyclaceae bacterium]
MKHLKAFVAGLALALAAVAFISLPATAGPLSDFAENALIDALLRGQTLTAPATMHWGFTTDACTD